jgi:predicted transcriptional regulator
LTKHAYKRRLKTATIVDVLGAHIMIDIQITDAELEVMKVLWDAPDGLSTGEIRGRLDKAWERTTVVTLLSRLTEKGAVAAKKGNYSYHYKSLIRKEDYGLIKTSNILDSLYNGSIRNMMSALCDAGRLTPDDLRELQEFVNKGGAST